MRRLPFVIVVLLTCLIQAAAAQAVVLSVGGNAFGVALVPGVPAPAAQPAASAGPCRDPWLAGDLGGPAIPVGGLCWRGGPVIHASEMFDLTWDPLRRGWSSTRNFVETYLHDVANGSQSTAGSDPLSSPYAVTAQYQDGAGRAANQDLYGGGCVDFGATGGSACKFDDTTGSAAGNEYPSSGCPVLGNNQFSAGPNGPIYFGANDVCLTDTQVKAEVARAVSQQGFIGHTQAGYAPMVTVMTPPGVIECLDAAGSLCSANSAVEPPKPTLTPAASGGSLPTGTYQVAVSYVLPTGESVASAPQTVQVQGAAAETTSGSSGTGTPSSPAPTNTGLLTIDAPPPVTGAKGWSAYVTQADGTKFYEIGSLSSPFPFGRSQAVTAPPSGSPTSLPTAKNAFCSYHSFVAVAGVQIPYVVQPWTALTGCDDPSAPTIPADPTPEELATGVGARLVSPVSQATIAALTDPFLNGWAALSGAEINDNGCGPLPNSLDTVPVGGNQYLLQRVFNNGGMLVSDPNTLRCAGNVLLQPRFVVPSAVDPGDVVEFDGTKTVSTLVVPRGGYVWDFGDGSSAYGPSVVHRYAKGGTYTVALAVTDRGGNTRTLSQSITVLGATAAKPTMTASIQLLPQSMRSVLRSGVMVRITANRASDGIESVSIPRSVARQAHLRTGSAANVVIGRGTLSGIAAGTRTIHVRLPAATARKLARLHHLTLTLRVTLMGGARLRTTVDAAGRY